MQLVALPLAGRMLDAANSLLEYQIDVRASDRLATLWLFDSIDVAALLSSPNLLKFATPYQGRFGQLAIDGS